MAKRKILTKLFAIGLLALISGCSTDPRIELLPSLDFIFDKIPTITPPPQNLIEELDKNDNALADLVWRYLEDVYVVNCELNAIKKIKKPSN